jgi:hypothetical protein
MSWHKPETHTTPSKGSVHDEGASEPLAVGRELCDRLKRMNDALEHEPVAWAVMLHGGPLVVSRFWNVCDDEARVQGSAASVVPLYAHPPQDRVVRLPRRTIATGPVGIGWNEAMMLVVAELEAAGVRWEYD